MTGEPLPLPTQDDLAAAAAAFESDWGAVVEVLYGICERHAGHSDRRAVTAKIALVDRAYSAGLERQVKPDPGEQAIAKIATFMLAHAGEVDKIIAGLDELHEPLDEGSMSAIVDQHGRFTTLLRQVTTRQTAPRSFAAKYLHFHHTAVPIYDSYAATRLGKVVRWDSGDIPVSRPHGADQEYWAFCVRLFRLYHACRQRNLSVTIKGLDAYLWQVPL